jgi:preprotein translocase subunit SecF
MKLKKYDNENAVTGVIAGIMVFVIVAVGAIGVIMITDLFNKQYDNSIADPVNSQGIYLNNSTPYESVKVISKGITDSIPVAIFLALLLAIILIVLLVWAILKRGD